MKAASATDTISRMIFNHCAEKLTGEVVIKVIYQSGGIRRLNCDVSDIRTQHFEITEEKTIEKEKP